MAYIQVVLEAIFYRFSPTKSYIFDPYCCRQRYAERYLLQIGVPVLALTDNTPIDNEFTESNSSFHEE